MSRIVEKRTVKVSPCRVEKELIRKIGELLENEESCEKRKSRKYA